MYNAFDRASVLTKVFLCSLVITPTRGVRLVDEGMEPASYVDQQLQGAYMQELGNAVSTETLQVCSNARFK